MRKGFTGVLAIFFLAFNLVSWADQSKLSENSTTDLLNQFYTLKAQNPEAGIQILKRLLQKDPTQVQARKELGYLYLTQKKPEMALSQFKMADKLSPNQPEIQAQIGYILTDLKETEAAKAYFTSAIKNAPPELKTKLETQLQALSTISKTDSSPQPSPDNLLNEFYQLKTQSPEKAEKALQAFLEKEPNHIKAREEMGYFLLNQNKKAQALEEFKKIDRLNPGQPSILAQTGYLLAELKKPEEARAYFIKASKTTDPVLRAQYQKALKNLATPPATKEKSENLEPTPPASPKISLNPVDVLFNQFYQFKQKDPETAEKAIQKAIALEPDKAKLREAYAYFLLEQKKDREALAQFKAVDQLTPYNYPIKMQIGYLLSKFKKNRAAYYWFDQATHSPDQKLRLNANQSMSNLAGTQTKLLPNPWFADIYTYPLHYSRFDLMVYPLQARAGRTWGIYDQLETYFSWRWTRDNRSGEITDAGLLPQIFEDNVAIYAAGFKYALFPTAKRFLKGLQVYGEGGKAQDLVDRSPLPKWRNDFRGGLLYYNDWGTLPVYTDKPTLLLHHLGTLYSDVTYYSRYRNTIGDVIFRDGFQVMRWGTASLNIYGKIQYLFDSQHEFYNNYVEYGPGISFVPNHRYGLVLRVEFMKGNYIPVNGPYRNPYASTYYNTLSMIEFYMKI